MVGLAPTFHLRHPSIFRSPRTSTAHPARAAATLTTLAIRPATQRGPSRSTACPRRKARAARARSFPFRTKPTLLTKPHRRLHHALRMEHLGLVLSVLSVLSKPRSPVLQRPTNVSCLPLMQRRVHREKSFRPSALRLRRLGHSPDA